MKKIILTLISQAILLSSCSNNILWSNKVRNKDQVTADLRTGTCLISKLNSPITKESNIKLNNILLREVRQIWKDAFVYTDSIDSISVYNDNFLLKITVFGTWEDSGGNGFGDSNRHSSWPDENNLRVGIKLFEIKTGRRIYYQEIKATNLDGLTSDEEGKGFSIYFINSKETVIKKTMVKGIRDLGRYVNKQRK